MVDETGPGDRHGADDHDPVGLSHDVPGADTVRAGTGVDGRQLALAGRLLRLRTAAGLGAGELADAAGLDPSYYREVEAGGGDLSGLTYLALMRLADALDVPPAAVLAD
jgi:hypothetical protein